MSKMTLCTDICGDRILLTKVIKELGNGLLETDGRGEDVTQTAISCVIEHMLWKCKDDGRDSLTYEVPNVGRLTFTPLQAQKECQSS